MPETDGQNRIERGQKGCSMCVCIYVKDIPHRILSRHLTLSRKLIALTRNDWRNLIDNLLSCPLSFCVYCGCGPAASFFSACWPKVYRPKAGTHEWMLNKDKYTRWASCETPNTSALARQQLLQQPVKNNKSPTNISHLPQLIYKEETHSSWLVEIFFFKKPPKGQTQHQSRSREQGNYWPDLNTKYKKKLTWASTSKNANSKQADFAVYANVPQTRPDQDSGQVENQDPNKS